MKKILMTGGSGLLGQCINIEADKFFELLALFNCNVGKCDNL